MILCIQLVSIPPRTPWITKIEVSIVFLDSCVLLALLIVFVLNRCSMAPHFALAILHLFLWTPLLYSHIYICDDFFPVASTCTTQVRITAQEDTCALCFFLPPLFTFSVVSSPPAASRCLVILELSPRNGDNGTRLTLSLATGFLASLASNRA